MPELRSNVVRYVIGLLALAAVLALAAGCGSGTETVAGSDGVAPDGVSDDGTADGEVTDDGPPSPIDRDALRSSGWTLRFGAGPDGEIELVDGWPITLTFETETLGGTAACNGYGSGYQIIDSRFILEGIGWTEMGCEPAVQAAEQAYFSALQDVDGINLVGDELALSGPSTELIFGPTAPVAVADLVGTLWLLETTIQDDVATAVQGEPATLLLNGDGTLTGGTGCRSLTGNYVVVGSEVLFPNFGAEGECPSALSAQDGKVVTVLGDGFVPEIDGDTLILSSVGNEGLGYRATTEDELSTLVASPVPSDAEVLEGIEWIFAGGDSADGPIVDPRTIDPEQEITLEFANDGYGGRAVCNAYVGTAVVENGRLELAPPPAPLNGCGEPFDAIIQAYYDALAQMGEFGIEADGEALVMSGNDIELLFERSPQ